MPNTLIPIQTYTLSSTASSVTFSNIPQNYTDLKVVVSARGTATSTEKVSDITLRINNDSGASYSYRGLTGVPGSSNTSTFVFTGSSSFQYLGFGTSSDATANTFGSTEFNFVNYTSSVGKSISVDTVAENNSSTTLLRFISGLWSPSTQAAISTLTFSLNSGNFDTNSTFTLYGISNGVKATGGTLTVAGGYAYHTFTSTGSFVPSQKINNAEVLIVAGGAGGGCKYGGGGGSGGVVYSSNQVLNAGNAYTVQVGSGGAGSSSAASAGVSGSNSIFGSVITAFGGGGGGSDDNTAGISGGSGGGSGTVGSGGSSTQSGTIGTNSFGYGNSGGKGYNSSSGTNYASGGGGGAGTVGLDAVTGPVGGSGGIGLSNWSSWGNVTSTGQNVSGTRYYAGGGGGSTGAGGVAGTGGYGGGGNGSNSGAGSAATANTGGGGGGGYGSGSAYAGGAGGSGIVIIRYPLSSDSYYKSDVILPSSYSLTLPPVSGYMLWLDASNTSSIISLGDSVVQWNDLSSNKYNFAQYTSANQPTTNTRKINGLNVLDFDGTNDKLISTNLSSVWNPFHNATGATFFVVTSLDVNQDQPMFTTSNDTTQIGMWLYTRSSSTDFAAAILNGTSNNFVSLEYSGTATYTANTPLVLSSVWNASNATAADRIKFYKNSGSETGQFGQSTQSYTSSNAIHPMYIGAWPGSNAFNGVIAEVIMYPGILSDSNRNAVSNYLKTKWGI